MSEDIRESLERVLECPICHGKVSDARILKCGHTFCQKCVMQLPHTADNSIVPCPCCREENEVCNSQLKRNFMINSVMDVLNNKEAPGSSKQMLCERHRGIEKKYICQRCAVAVCSECIVSEHFSHYSSRESRPVTLEQAKKTLNEILDKSKDWMRKNDAVGKEVNNIKEEGTKVLNRLEQKIEGDFRSRVDELEKAKKRMLSSLKSEKRTFGLEIDTILRGQTERSDEITHGVSRVVAGVKRGAPEDIVTTYVSDAKMLKKYLFETGPSARGAKAKLDVLNALSFEKNNAADEHVMGQLIHKRRIGNYDLRNDSDLEVEAGSNASDEHDPRSYEESDDEDDRSDSSDSESNDESDIDFDNDSDHESSVVDENDNEW